MIRLTPEIALQVEQAAIDSLVQHGNWWRSQTPDDLQERQIKELTKLYEYDTLSIEQILEGNFLRPMDGTEAAAPDTRTTEEFLHLLVTLAVLRQLLTPSQLVTPPTLRVV
jgi:hypothetical protein